MTKEQAMEKARELLGELWNINFYQEAYPDGGIELLAKALQDASTHSVGVSDEEMIKCNKKKEFTKFEVMMAKVLDVDLNKCIKKEFNIEELLPLMTFLDIHSDAELNNPKTPLHETYARLCEYLDKKLNGLTERAWLVLPERKTISRMDTSESTAYFSGYNEALSELRRLNPWIKE